MVQLSIGECALSYTSLFLVYTQRRTKRQIGGGGGGDGPLWDTEQARNEEVYRA